MSNFGVFVIGFCAFTFFTLSYGLSELYRGMKTFMRAQERLDEQIVRFLEFQGKCNEEAARANRLTCTRLDALENL